MNEKFIEYLSKRKTLIFLIMCLMVHVFNAIIFSFLKLIPLSAINFFSAFFYALIIVKYKQYKDFYIIFTYIEIISFSLISELFTGGSFFYIFYVIGMISSVYYLLPPKKRLKQFFQLLGIIYAITIYFIHIKEICLFPKYLPLVNECKHEVGLLNLCITLFTLYYISNLYFFEMNTANEKLTYYSNHDLLTGLFNRRYFEQTIYNFEEDLEQRYTIAIFDIDDFKKVNDTYGHQVGDAVLKKVSGIIQDMSDKEFLAVRWGGEEFVLYMPKLEKDAAYTYLETLRKEIEKTVVEFESLKIRVTVTVGMYTGTKLSDFEETIKQADEKLYYGKRNGKNCVVK